MVEIEIFGGVTVVDAVHSGSSNFQVSLASSTGDQRELFVNEIGKFKGEKARLLKAETYHLEVVADGDWWLEVRQPRKVGVEELPRSIRDTKPRVIGPFTFRGSHTMACSHQGERNFQVSTLPTDGRPGTMLVNVIGQYADETAFQAMGKNYLVVEADGEWMIDLE